MGALVVPASTHENRTTELMLQHLTEQGVSGRLELVPVDRGVTRGRGRGWDISIMDLPTDADSLSDIPADFRPEPVGAQNDLIAAIREVAPSSDFSDPRGANSLLPTSSSSST